MAEDVRRHRQGLPVEARGTTSWYVLKKFARRHRASVSAAALLLLSLIVFSAVSVKQARQIGMERDRVAEQRDISQQVVAFMSEVFEAAEPDAATGHEMTVREALDVGALRIQTNLRDTPQARAAFMNVIGSAYGVVGERVRGEELLRDALDIRSEIDEGSLETSETLNDLGVVQLRARRIDEADSMLTRALEIRLDRGASETEIATTRLNLAIVRERQRRFAEADTLYTLAMPVYRSRFGPTNRRWAIATNNLAMLRRTAGRGSDAESLLVDVLPAVRGISARAPGTLALTLTNLGTVLHERGAHEEGEAMLREAVDIYRAQPNAGLALAATLQNLAAVLGAQGRRLEAEVAFREVITLREARLLPTDIRLATVRNNLATMWRRAGNPEKAEPEFREAVRIARTNPFTVWRTRAQLEINWAWTLMLLGRGEEALEVYDDLEDAWLRGDDVPASIAFDLLWGKGRTLGAMGRAEEAVASYRAALAHGDEALAKDDIRHWRLRAEYGAFLADRNRGEDARPLLRQAIDSLAARGDQDESFLVEAREALARAGGG